MPRQVATLTLADARRIIQAGEQKAAELKIPYNIAVVDAGGSLISHVRMDGAWLGSIDVALRKAKTARYFNMETGELGKWSQPGGPGWQIEHANGGLITIAGGLPIRNKKGEIIGAIGASGSSAEIDQDVAQVGANAVK